MELTILIFFYINWHHTSKRRAPSRAPHLPSDEADPFLPFAVQNPCTKTSNQETTHRLELILPI